MRSHFFQLILAALWVFFPLGFPALRFAAEAGGGGAAPPAPEPGADGKTGAGAGNGGQPGAAAADVQGEVQKALAAQAAQFNQQLKAITGHESVDALKQAEAMRKGEEAKLLAERAAENAALREQLARERVNAALLSAASDSVDPALVAALLAGQGTVAEGGAVSIGGKPVAEAVKALLAEKPYLARAGKPGGGAPASGASSVPNPFAKETLNITEQMRLKRENPALYQQLKAQAGRP
jgi:hypothetical protein